METVKINMVPKGAVKAAHASQGDAPRVVRFELFDEFLPYTLDGSEDITLTVVRPDTEEIVSSVENTEEAYIDVSFTSEMTAIRGVANCEIKISKSGAVIGSHNFDLNIERDAYGEDITVETAQGVIATFTTGVIDNLVGLKTTFEPKQDLHGYETPWIDSNVINKAPYLSRALAGTASRIGNYEFNKLVGGTYAFNQLVQNGNFVDSSNWSAYNGNISVTNNVLTLTALEGSSTVKTLFNWTTPNVANGHKCLTMFSIKPSENITVRLRFPFVSDYVSITANVWSNISFIGISDENNYGIQSYYNLNETIEIKNYNCIDLTQMLGSTIADYIYSLETAQAGAGVSFFKSLFGADYYAYNVGELMSVKTSAHVTKDANNNVISNIALDPDIELRGIPKLDENNKLYYDGDTYESNGDVTRRYGIVDLGSLTWEYLSDYTFWRSTGIASLVKTQASQMDMVNFIAYPYVIHNTQSLINLGLNCLQVGTSGNLWVNNGSDSVTPSGYLVYELATPTTESADPFTDPQEIDASGSEEFIDARAVSIPVGHESYYANICEIEGIDEINLFHTGVNLFDKDTIVSGYIDDADGVLKSTTSTVYKSSDYISVKGGENYYIKTEQNGALWGAWYDINKNYISGVTSYKNTVKTAPDNAAYMRLTVVGVQTQGGNADTFGVNYPATDTEYHAYDGESALVEIGQTVYGGYYDKDLGIVLTHIKYVYDGSENWTTRESGVGTLYELNITEPIKAQESISNMYVWQLNLTNNYTFRILESGNIRVIAIHDDNKLDLLTFKAFLSNNNLSICYELETPIIIPADAVNFETVKGVNNVWSDTNGETEVKFYVKEA